MKNKNLFLVGLLLSSFLFYSTDDSSAVTVRRTRYGHLLKATMTFDVDSKGNVSGARNIIVRENETYAKVGAFVVSRKTPKRSSDGKSYSLWIQGKIVDIDAEKWPIDYTIHGFRK